MISIIVSSYRSEMFNALSSNIDRTIGNTIYEIIQVWNPNTMSIAQAYNKGAKEVGTGKGGKGAATNDKSLVGKKVR